MPSLKITLQIENKYKQTIVNNTASTPLGIKHRVPQGSTLGPLLFILYINDVIKYLEGVSVSLYADDTVIYTANTDSLTNIQILNHNADLFYRWCNLNKLTVNISKSKCMLFSNINERTSVNLRKNACISLDKQRLTFVNEYKYLGVIVDNTLTFKPHVNYINRIATSRLYILSKIRRSLGFKHAL